MFNYYYLNTLPIKSGFHKFTIYVILLKKRRFFSVIFSGYLSTEPIPFAEVQSGTYSSSRSTVSMRIKCLLQGHHTLIQPRVNALIYISRNQLSMHMSNKPNIRYFSLSKRRFERLNITMNMFSGIKLKKIWC